MGNSNMRNGSIKSPGEKVGMVVIYIFLTIIAALTLYPVLYVFFGSFKENQELVLGGLNLLPNKFIIANYTKAWNMANFGLYTLNSIYLSVGVTFIVLFTSSMAGYCFARKNFPLKNFIYGALIAFMFINVGSISLRPLFELATALKLNKSIFSIIFISAAGMQATNIFLVRGYMNTIPKELDEAATIDGCGFFERYIKIILPLLKPVMATVALLTFRSAWNEYILPLVFTMSNVKLRPLTVGVVALRYAGDGAAAWNIMFAGSAMSIIPIVVIYIFSSRYFMTGLAGGAVKG